jgi:hypothetical protein
VPPLEQRGAGAGHPDRCWLSADQKVKLRVVDETGAIGLKAADS